MTMPRSNRQYWRMSHYFFCDQSKRGERSPPAAATLCVKPCKFGETLSCSVFKVRICADGGIQTHISGHHGPLSILLSYIRIAASSLQPRARVSSWASFAVSEKRRSWDS